MNSTGFKKNTSLAEKVCFSVNIDRTVRDGLDRLATDRKRSRSALANEALATFLKTEKAK